MIYWPLEDCVTVVKENALQQGKKCEVGEEYSVKYCGKVVTEIVAGIGKWYMLDQVKKAIRIGFWIVYLLQSGKATPPYLYCLCSFNYCRKTNKSCDLDQSYSCL